MGIRLYVFQSNKNLEIARRRNCDAVPANAVPAIREDADIFRPVVVIGVVATCRKEEYLVTALSFGRLAVQSWWNWSILSDFQHRCDATFDRIGKADTAMLAFLDVSVLMERLWMGWRSAAENKIARVDNDRCRQRHRLFFNVLAFNMFKAIAWLISILWSCVIGCPLCWFYLGFAVSIRKLFGVIFPNYVRTWWTMIATKRRGVDETWNIYFETWKLAHVIGFSSVFRVSWKAHDVVFVCTSFKDIWKLFKFVKVS